MLTTNWYIILVKFSFDLFSYSPFPFSKVQNSWMWLVDGRKVVEDEKDDEWVGGCMIANFQQGCDWRMQIDEILKGNYV